MIEVSDSEAFSANSSTNDIESTTSQADQTPDLEAIKEKNRKVGFMYLWFRSIEYYCRIPANALKASQVSYLSAPAKITSAIGYFSGMIGNWFQGEQGLRDERLCRLDESQSLEKKIFARIAMTRGAVNLVGDGSSLIIQMVDDPTLRVTAATASTIGHILGFIKNCRDIQIYDGKRRIGFLLCATARPFLVASAWGLTASSFEQSSEDSSFDPTHYKFYAYLCGIIGMALFNTGAMIRQHQDAKDYSHLKDEYSSPRGFFNFFCCRRTTTLPEQDLELQDQAVRTKRLSS